MNSSLDSWTPNRFYFNALSHPSLSIRRYPIRARIRPGPLDLPSFSSSPANPASRANDDSIHSPCVAAPTGYDRLVNRVIVISTRLSKFFLSVVAWLYSSPSTSTAREQAFPSKTISGRETRAFSLRARTHAVGLVRRKTKANQAGVQWKQQLVTSLSRLSN